jgi:hypothetical protein
MKKEEFNKITDDLSIFLNSLVTINRKPNAQQQLFDNQEEKDDLVNKLDFLERAIELVRIRYRCLHNNLDFDKFVHSEIYTKSGHLSFNAPISFPRNRPGTAPIYLQPKLLIYLLYRYNNEKQEVYDIIEKFIKLIWNQLKIRDFEKTKTGVIRCFTNTRFAANKLREYGLLKFTKQEAYKTWILSFSGIMVASKFLKDEEWGKPLLGEEYRSDLHPGIKESFKSLQDHREFVKTLLFVTKPETKLINENSVGTEKTHELISSYHSIFKNINLTKKEKKKSCNSILKQLDNDKDIIMLFRRLSLDLKVGEIKELPYQ